ncbi:MAG TPA: glycosyltransferase [Bacteroidales bacterium]|nr:glycosyltransferase [Bacteroidales bacterium]
MKPEKILISPLNWGFGHAGRMIPLALALRERGHEIVFCAHRDVIPMLTRELPGISIIAIPGLHIIYFRKIPLWFCVLLHLPHIIAVSVREHFALQRLAAELHPDIIISDNRFGFYHKDIFSVYVTHMIRIPFPPAFRFLEPAGIWLHRKVIEKFNLCLIPDFPGDINLSGRLSHGIKLPRNTTWSGPLSRFESSAGNAVAMNIPYPYRCLVLSGPEPQRSILKGKVTDAADDMHLVILEGAGEHNSIAHRNNVTVVSNPDTRTMKTIISGSAAVICRSGYTTVMELASLHQTAIIIPTPGQPEQEYLGEHLGKIWGFMTLNQGEIATIKDIKSGPYTEAMPCFPESDKILAAALDLLTEKEK